LERASREVQGWDPGKLTRKGRLRALARLVRIEHTLFSLPYAYLGAYWAAGEITLWEAFWLGMAVVGLRLASMAYNNIADYDIDRENPRTRNRPLVTGAVSFRDAWILVLIGSIIYYASAAALNRLALALSPILWIVALTYPHAKRYHWLPHLHLGLTLGLVVFGGAIGAYGDEAAGLVDALRRVPWVLVAAVTLWVAGFDIVYSIQDAEFDRRMGLGSVPARLGEKAALRVAAAMHLAAGALFALAAHGIGSPIAYVSLGLALALLIVQHVIVAECGLACVRVSFNMNLAVGLIVGVGYTLGLALG